MPLRPACPNIATPTANTLKTKCIKVIKEI